MKSYEVHLDGVCVITTTSYQDALQDYRRLKREHPKSKVEIKTVQI